MRIEEKALAAAFEAAGHHAVQMNPLDVPFLIGGQRATDQVDWVVDRCTGRVAVSMLAPMISRSGRRIFDAGLASTGTRIDIATVLQESHLPRPLTAVIATESAGLAALETLGYPSTLMPTAPGSATLPALDKDVGEALLEHRETLGHMGERVMIAQQGHAAGDRLHRLIVVDGHVVATGKDEERTHLDDTCALAIATSAAVGATLCGVSILKTEGGYVVWDVDPVPAFRDFDPLEGSDPVSAIVAMVLGDRSAITSKTRSADVILTV